MALVEVESRRLVAKLTNGANPADPHQELLAHTVFTIAAVEAIGHAAPKLLIDFEIRVEKEQPGSAHVGLPNP